MHRIAGHAWLVGLLTVSVLGGALLACGSEGEPCQPSCTDRCCGDDGCGGTCPDACPTDWHCDTEACGCVEDNPCVPTTCLALQLECGPADDGCGHTLDCGGCQTGYECRSSRCIDETCVSLTCAQQNIVCGPAEDGCTLPLDCGECPIGEMCRRGGCEPSTCDPNTCEEQHKTCGPVNDGCGHTLDCGACPIGQVCPAGTCVAGDDPAAPPFDTFAVFATEIPPEGGGRADPADIYYPDPADLATAAYAFPLALLLQDAKVDKADYSAFAGLVARHGFAVAVPNHSRRVSGVTDFFPEEKQLPAALAHFRTLEAGGAPFSGKLDTDTLVVIGHGFGGRAGLWALQDKCVPPYCGLTEIFARPAELKGGVFLGTALDVAGAIDPVTNDDLPAALLVGDLDGLSLPADVTATYEQIVDPPRALVTLLGANHYAPCGRDQPAGADPDPNAATLASDLSATSAGHWTALFLRATVLLDAGAADWVYVSGDARDKNATVQSVH